MSPIEIIDTVLKLMSEDIELVPTATQGQIFVLLVSKYPKLQKQVSMGIEFLRMLHKLESDGYIQITKREEYLNDSNEPYNIEFMYSVTFDGALFSQQGGYAGQMNRANAESIRVETLAETQRVNANRMTYLTTVLASFAALSVLIQSLDKFHTVFSIQFWTAVFLFCAGALTAVCIWLMILHMLQQKNKKL